MFEETMTLLRRHRIRPMKRAGQHHVIDPTVLERMVDYAQLHSGEVVLEIGAGVGYLTELLARRAGDVIAVESDGRLIKVLVERLAGLSNVKILHGDALRIELPDFDKVVSNLPYQISSDITFKILEHKFDTAVLMFQKEFADRLMAASGSKNYSRLTVNVYYRANVELLDEVPPAAFYPQPKVTSRIVRLKPREPPFDVADFKFFNNVVRALFQHRRQRVRNALLRSFAEVFPDKAITKVERRIFIERAIPGGLAETRVMDLPPEKFGEIADCLAG